MNMVLVLNASGSQSRGHGLSYQLPDDWQPGKSDGIGFPRGDDRFGTIVKITCFHDGGYDVASDTTYVLAEEKIGFRSTCRDEFESVGWKDIPLPEWVHQYMNWN
jgi:hypothetical protein